MVAESSSLAGDRDSAEATMAFQSLTVSQAVPLGDNSSLETCRHHLSAPASRSKLPTNVAHSVSIPPVVGE